MMKFLIGFCFLEVQSKEKGARKKMWEKNSPNERTNKLTKGWMDERTSERTNKAKWLTGCLIAFTGLSFPSSFQLQLFCTILSSIFHNYLHILWLPAFYDIR